MQTAFPVRPFKKYVHVSHGHQGMSREETLWELNFSDVIQKPCAQSQHLIPEKMMSFVCEKIVISFLAECVFFDRPLDQQVARHLLVMQYVTTFLIRYRVMSQSTCIPIGPEETCMLPNNLSEKVT